MHIHILNSNDVMDNLPAVLLQRNEKKTHKDLLVLTEANGKMYEY